MKADLMKCRVCGTSLSEVGFDDPGPSLTSIRTVLDLPTQVLLCDVCGHAQSPDLPNIPQFYDTQYRISLDIDGHDQLYQNNEGQQVFRTAYQAEMVLDLDIAHNAKILDFGAGKATTMKRVVDARPDLIPYVFDVSSDYTEHWAEWVPLENTATYRLPKNWGDKFDLITAHFVLEHVQSPVEILKEISHCLAPEGRLFFSVPDVEGNTGDLLVVDHLNHFTLASITNALAKSNLIIDNIDRSVFSGAFVIIAKKGRSNECTLIDNSELQNTLNKWKIILDKLVLHKLDGPVAIYGAGFYGSLISTRLSGSVSCFIDKNPYLQSQEHFGLPVFTPHDCPGNIKFVIAGLNPANARNILSNSPDWLPKHAEIIYLD